MSPPFSEAEWTGQGLSTAVARFSPAHPHVLQWLVFQSTPAGDAPAGTHLPCVQAPLRLLVSPQAAEPSHPRIFGALLVLLISWLF